MSGYNTYTRFQRIEAQAKLLGFRLGRPPNHYTNDYGDMVTLYPDDTALPIYRRDAELWTGSFNDIELFLMGWAKAQQYDAMLRMTNDKRRQKFEDAERARQAEQKKREEQRQMLAVLKASDAENSKKKK